MNSRKDASWLAAAAKIASVSTCRQRHGAILVSAGRVLAASPNVHRNSPLVVSDPKSESSVHAEIAVLRQLRYEIPKRSTLYVARINPAGEQMLSAPCSSCAVVLEDFGMMDVVWTTSESK